MLAFFIIVGLYYSNQYKTAYLPINSNVIFDNTGMPYDVSLILNDKMVFDQNLYDSYSPIYLSAAMLARTMFFFALYTAVITYVYLYHGREIKMGFKSFISTIRGQDLDTDDADLLDVHSRQMKKYKQVPLGWYLVVLVASIAVGVAGLTAYPTTVTPGVIFFGIFLCLIFQIPTGIIMSITGMFFRH